MDISKYQVKLKPIGKGKFGDVILAKLLNDENLLAIKVIERKKLRSPALQAQVKKEIDILSVLDHKYVIKMKHSFEDETNIYIVFDYYPGGDLYKKTKRKPLEETECKKYIRQLCEAVKYLHSLNIIHRDIKIDNILLDQDDNIKLCDFGWATVSNGKESLFCGTIDYVAPELVLEKEYDNKVDIWCIGMTTYELLTGTLPFKDNSYKKTYDNIVFKDITYPDTLSEECKDFMMKALKKNPDERINLDEMLNHPWLVQNFE